MATRAAAAGRTDGKREVYGRVHKWKRVLVPVTDKAGSLASWNWVQTGECIDEPKPDVKRFKLTAIKDSSVVPLQTRGLSDRAMLDAQRKLAATTAPVEAPVAFLPTQVSTEVSFRPQRASSASAAIHSTPEDPTDPPLLSPASAAAQSGRPASHPGAQPQVAQSATALSKPSTATGSPSTSIDTSGTQQKSQPGSSCTAGADASQRAKLKRSHSSAGSQLAGSVETSPSSADEPVQPASTAATPAKASPLKVAFSFGAPASKTSAVASKSGAVNIRAGAAPTTGGGNTSTATDTGGAAGTATAAKFSFGAAAKSTPSSSAAPKFSFGAPVKK